MNRKLTLIAGLLTATTTYLLTANKRTTYSKPEAQSPEPTPESIEWISAKDFGPMYEIGDDVVTVNPFTHDFAIVDIDGATPLYYEIQAVIYDEDEGTFRYQLNGENEWYAEDWLDDAPYPYMSKSLADKSDLTMAKLIAEESKEGRGDGMKADEVTRLTKTERDELSKAMDDNVRAWQVDYCLERLTYGNAEEKAEAERVLAELSAKNSEEA